MIDGSQITTYAYDVVDRLANVTLPDATAITHLILTSAHLTIREGLWRFNTIHKKRIS